IVGVLQISVRIIVSRMAAGLLGLRESFIIVLHIHASCHANLPHIRQAGRLSCFLACLCKYGPEFPWLAQYLRDFCLCHTTVKFRARLATDPCLWCRRRCVRAATYQQEYCSNSQTLNWLQDWLPG